MPGGFRVKRIVTITTQAEIPVYGQIHPYVHPFIRYPYKSNGFILGVEYIYNKTKEKYITNHISSVTDDAVFVDPNYMEIGDVIEIVSYHTGEGLIDGALISDLEEPIYRHASHFDRIDFGNFEPNTKWAGINWTGPETVATNYNKTEYTIRDRIFYNFSGYTRPTGRQSDTDSTGKLTTSPATVISWSPSEEHTIGYFLGDRSLIDSKNTNNTEHGWGATPFYLTNMKVYLSENVGSYSKSEGEMFALAIEININGANRFMRNSPGYEKDSEKKIVTGFGDDRLLYGSFSYDDEGSLVIDYNGLRPAKKMLNRDNSNDGPDTNMYQIDYPLGILRANSVLVKAWIITDDKDKAEISPWYISLGGIMPYSTTEE